MDDETYRKLLVFIDNIKEVNDWHAAFEGLLFVFSDTDSSEIAEKLRGFLGPRARLFVSHLNQGSNSGFLAGETWEWMRENKLKLEPIGDTDETFD